MTREELIAQHRSEIESLKSILDTMRWVSLVLFICLLLSLPYVINDLRGLCQ